MCLLLELDNKLYGMFVDLSSFGNLADEVSDVGVDLFDGGPSGGE